ncbi:hypothetical protein APHAL10511_005839 [Amanita phalloides]|nr:hypothetical protein APHAL10511_005839 [Amanita phalloides]
MTDPHVEYSHQVYSHLSKRAILPLVRKPGVRFQELAGGLPDLSNVQGDVVFLFPKTAENFIFFKINDVSAFKTALKSFKPTSSKDVKDLLDKINAAKQNAAKQAASRSFTAPSVDQAQFQIAFSRAGLNALGVTEGTGDTRFDTRPMSGDKGFLGDQGEWDDPFTSGDLHGVITVAGHTADKCTEWSNQVIQLFGSSITVAGGKPVEGRTRPGDMKGHEHFGFKDGISQPALRGVVAHHTGQIQVDPGVIIMGYKGDPVLEDPNNTTKRPAWTKDGTILVFRKLEQDVLLFQWFRDQNLKPMRDFLLKRSDAPSLTDDQVKDLFGARLIGRWTSGAPLATCPYKDNTQVAEDPEKNNDFDYVIRNDPNISPLQPSDYICPFTAHTRKTAPRNLNPYVLKEFLETGSIVRGGLPYGPEVTDDERRRFDPNNLTRSPRGLLFNCYAASLDEGFVRQTIAYAGNDYFPLTSFQPQKHGQDPVLGSPEKKKQVQVVGDYQQFQAGERVNFVVSPRRGDPLVSQDVEVSGFAQVTDLNQEPQPGDNNPFFVTSRGGEYFFVPSISTLQSWSNSATTQTSDKLDILFLVDATSSMQPCIDQVRKSVKKLQDDLVASGKWSRQNLRFGLVAFRDYPQNGHDYGFVTRQYPFDTDPDALQSNLSILQATGGGDGPEAQVEAFAQALNPGWANDAIKVAILITDSPPHGLNEIGDKFPDGSSDQKDPARIVNRLAKLGVTLHVLSCEPTLSLEYDNALDFYRGMVKKASGRLFGLSDVQKLADFIIGGIVETKSIENIAFQKKSYIQSLAAKRINADDISRQLHADLTAAKVKLDTFDVDDIYASNQTGDDNADVWFKAEKIDKQTLAKIKDVRGYRIKDEYRNGNKAPSTRLSVKPVSLYQVQAAVQRSLATMT